MTSFAPEVASFLAALDKTQYLPPDRMQAYQRRLLEVLLRHARRETEFYAERLRPMFRADDGIDWERWREIPILTRREAQENFATLSARSLPKAAGEAEEDTSSGSTGRPLRHLTTGIQNVASACCSERFFTWHALDPDALAARIRATTRPEAAWPNGRRTTGWRIGHKESRVIELSIDATTDQQLEWLGRVRPSYLVTYPSNLRELGRAAAAGQRLHFGALLSVGEMVSDDMRDAIRRYFGVEPLDRYGSSEVGHIAAACPHSHKLHVGADVVLLEVVADDGSPVAPGTAGRVIVTPFYNLAMPLIRYDLGDYAVMAEAPCPCGRTLPLVERVLGRTRNVFHFIDGTSVWPVLLSREMHQFVPSRQFQVVQRTATDIDFRYVAANPDQQNDAAGLEAYMKKRLHPSVTVKLVAVDEIKRSAGGKFEDYVCLIE